MSSLFKSKKLIAVSIFSLAALGGACNSSNTTVNTNVPANAANTSAPANANSNANLVTTGENTVINAREPEQYQANIALKLETVANTNNATSLPPISALVSKMGNNRRMEFTLPNNEKIVYLDLGGRQLVVSPNRQQYAELTKEATGFDMRRLLMPEQIVTQLNKVKGIVRAGEEQVNGRTAEKYTYDATTDTKSQAGNVATQAVVLVDKETGLPLRSETYSESADSSVQGIKGLRFITEMSNLNMTPDAASFAEPTNFKKVSPEEVRAQVNLIFAVATQFLGQAMQQGQQNQTAPANNQPMNNQPMNASPSPAATAARP